MSVLDLHAEALVGAARNMPVTPEARPQTSFSAWRMTTAVPRGVAAGAAQSGGFLADVLGAFGQTMAATDARPGGMFARQAPDSGEARERLLRTGPDMSSEAGDLLRSAADFYRPDPKTAHAAETITFDFARFASKAVGYSLLGGPVVGAGLTAADEGMTAADELRLKGVDLATRTKVGAVTAVTAGAGVALPVVGRTWAQTAALVALGGPASFVAQQAATREILANADYDKLAEQYDPFDPVGLALSTLVPAGFGAWAMRGAARRAPGPTVSRETEDAARVALAAEEQQRASLAPEGDLAAQAADQQAQQRAAQQMAAGERVDVTDVAPMDSPRVAEAVAEMRARVDEAVPPGAAPWEQLRPPPIDDGVRRSVPLEDARLADAAVREQLQFMAAEAGWSMKGGQLLRSGVDEAGDGGMGGEVVGRTSWQAQAEWYAAMQRDKSTRLPNDKAGVQEAVRKALAGEKMTPQERRAVRYMLEIAREDADPLSGVNIARELEAARLDDTADNRVDTALVARAAEIDETAVERMAVEAGDNTAAFMAAIERFLDEHDADPGAAAAGRQGDQPAARAEDARPAAVEGVEAEPPKVAAQAETGAARARLAEIQAQFPDLEVRLDGMDESMRLSEFLRMIEKQAADEVADAQMYPIAAQCALLNGP